MIRTRVEVEWKDELAGYEIYKGWWVDTVCGPSGRYDNNIYYVVICDDRKVRNFGPGWDVRSLEFHGAGA